MRKRKWTSNCTLVFVAVLLIGFEARAARVATTSGDIEGITNVIDGTTVDIYLGIPFAKPPLGDLRFRAPQPVDRWKNVKKTKAQPKSCIQSIDTNFGQFEGVEMWNANTNINEDCLYLNLWVPRINNNKKTTLIWIYGGGYTSGSITLDVYDGKQLAAKQGIIIASMQYRMGAMGFFYTGTEDAPGNMGLLDQQLAMRWIHENIDHFGGSRDNITLFGESAGAGSVSHHLFSELSWPYFNNAIMLSGSSFAPWAIKNPESLVNRTKSLAKLLNCPHAHTKDMIKCLCRKDAMDIERNQWLLDDKFSPTVDGKFMRDYPVKLLESGRIKRTNVLLGNTKHEGEYFLHYFYPDVFPAGSLWNPAPLNRSQYLDVVCRIGDCQGHLDRDGFLYTYELSRLPSHMGIYRNILDDILGDWYFKCPVRSLAKKYSKLSDTRTYLYSFEYRHSANPWPSWMGALHGYEIEIVFGQPFNRQLNYSDLDRKVSAKVMDFIATFAKTGNLDALKDEWPEFTTNSEQHIVFSQDGSTHIREGFRTKECSFWEYLLPKLRQETSDVRSNGICRSISIAFVWLSVAIATAVTR
ncbi:cholinesterase-like isoform X1 [Mercenaria mercenaria]|uniref:cholinesterase-like isoform X1 n=1 Tax=Mercenaria mercenaria TaxID=6596 RepID=UPI00234E9EB9|nr:cholinesterase-like isoform X1 [Mercenaria mercenaria]